MKDKPYLEPDFFTIHEFAQLMAITYAVAENMAVSGHVKAIKIGSQWRILKVYYYQEILCAEYGQEVTNAVISRHKAQAAARSQAQA